MKLLVCLKIKTGNRWNTNKKKKKNNLGPVAQHDTKPQHLCSNSNSQPASG